MFWDKQPKILMVEDTLSNHDLYREAFGEAGFDVVMCQTADGDFAGEVTEHQPDIISMDLMIAKEGEEAKRDGFQAMALLKSDPKTEQIPIIVLTNFFHEDKVQMAKAMGAVDYMNLQGQSIQQIAERFKSYLDSPKKYTPTNPMFAEEK